MLISRRGLIVGGAMSLAFARSVAANTQITMAELYADDDFSERAKLFNGTPVTMQGFMAPPLKADAKFFVLTNIPMAVCPFCAEVAEWPEDIVVVYTNRAIDVVEFDNLIDVQGKLDLGAWTDSETGFVSKVRLVEATYRRKPRVQTGPLGFGEMFIGN